MSTLLQPYVRKPVDPGDVLAYRRLHRRKSFPRLTPTSICKGIWTRLTKLASTSATSRSVRHKSPAGLRTPRRILSVSRTLVCPWTVAFRNALAATVRSLEYAAFHSALTLFRHQSLGILPVVAPKRLLRTRTKSKSSASIATRLAIVLVIVHSRGKISSRATTASK